MSVNNLRLRAGFSVPTDTRVVPACRADWRLSPLSCPDISLFSRRLPRGGQGSAQNALSGRHGPCFPKGGGQFRQAAGTAAAGGLTMKAIFWALAIGKRADGKPGSGGRLQREPLSAVVQGRGKPASRQQQADHDGRVYGNSRSLVAGTTVRGPEI